MTGMAQNLIIAGALVFWGIVLVWMWRRDSEGFMVLLGLFLNDPNYIQLHNLLVAWIRHFATMRSERPFWIQIRHDFRV